MLFFTEEKIGRLRKELRASIYREVHPITHFKFRQGPCEGAHIPGFDDREWADFQVGDYWGGYDVTAWFRARVPIPAHLKDEKIALRFLVGPRDGGNSTAETMLYVNGVPLQGIDVWHEEAWLPPELLQGDAIAIGLKAWSGVLQVPDRRRFKLAQLVWIDEDTEQFCSLVDVLHDAARQLDANDWRRVRLLEALNEAFHVIDFSKPGSAMYYGSVARARQLLEARLSELRTLEPVKPTVVGIGHSHIDLIWLWRLRHTREKAARTFTTALHLMRQYPQYRYTHSSPQLYKYLSQDYPDLLARVKECIASGEWEITGGMWVEADINIPSGESLVRQILFGKRYMREAFGVDSQVLWLPDVFGYSWALPQIICKSGMKYFVTSKISWNQFNRFPYDTFHWRGIDGSEVLTYFITTPEENSHFFTYNGQMLPDEVKGIWDNYHQKDINDELMLTFGWGDGGGGPTKEMLERARWMENIPGLPRVTIGKVEPYLARLEQRLRDQAVPVWDDELYLEYHRGTYTSQAYNKRANRTMEVLYHDAEWLSAVADVLTGAQAYPAAELRAGWELLLLNQFHDMLPGSSIHAAYEDSRQDYAAIERVGRAVFGGAQQRILQGIAAESPGVVVFNSLGTARSGLVELPWSAALEGQTVLDRSGWPAPVQWLADGRLLLAVEDVPALGYRSYPLVPVSDDPAEPALVVTPEHLENAYYDIRLNPLGQIVSLYDKRHDRDVLAPGALGNVLQVFEDKPLGNDAWDIDPFYQEKRQIVGDLQRAEVEETGPLRGVLRLEWCFYDSTITQRIIVYRDSPRIDFRTELDWHEHQMLLKAAFPVDVRATHATYDIQFGNIARPTHWNTSWDYARFECVGHKWVDLSEGNYGVSLLNDCKYGHDVKDNVLRLTLLKCGIYPDEQADQGYHLFTYSLLPHAGDWRHDGTASEAYALNYPLAAALVEPQPGAALPECFQLAAVDADHVIVETVKRAEDGDALIIRLYEYKQYRSKSVRLTLGQPIRRAVACNLIEEEEQPVAHDDRTIAFPIAPYEVKTFKVWL